MRYSHLDPEKSKTLPGDKAETLFESFLNSPPDRAFVVAQLGQSLDGRIATLTGRIPLYQPNGSAGPSASHPRTRGRGRGRDRDRFGRQSPLECPAGGRAQSGAGRYRSLRTPAVRRHCMNDDGARRIVIRKTSSDCAAGALELVVPARTGRPWPAAIVDVLFALGSAAHPVEGGARTIRPSSTQAASTGCMSLSRR